MKILTIISAIMLSVAAHATHLGEVVVLSNAGERFYVSMNGNFQNYYPTSSMQTKVSGERVYNFRILDADNRFVFDQNIFVRSSRRLTYRIVQRFHHQYQLELVGDMPLNTNSYYGDRPIIHRPPQQTVNQFGSCGIPNNYYNNVMSDAEFQRLKSAVNNESFSDDQLRVARHAARNKRMSVAQIKEIARLFSFSSEKLEFTKAAYRNCIDKSNYYEVMDVFTFSSDKRKLGEFIEANS